MKLMKKSQDIMKIKSQYKKQMEVCKWIKHIDEGCYTAECGWIQGINVRPKQKICHCGRRIERINLDTLSKPMQELKSALQSR